MTATLPIKEARAPGPWRLDEGKGAIHGGPDEGPAIVWDFSSNANAVPLPDACRALLLTADRSRYPDPGYGALRACLADAAGTHADLIVPTAGTSEAIRRLTLAARLQGASQVWVPDPAYGDYAAAAGALRLDVHRFRIDDIGAIRSQLLAACRQGPVLLWVCDPCNPTGRGLPSAVWDEWMGLARMQPSLILAVDRAYAPLRSHGVEGMPDAGSNGQALTHGLARHAWQCWSPNKALGLTGVRAGWMQAPQLDQAGLLHTVAALAPSWVLSAEGVAMLSHWHDRRVQSWLAQARATLAGWALTQRAALVSLGWSVRPSQVPFFLASPPPRHSARLPSLLIHLRARGIKLRDATSFGLPGMVRLRVHEPAAQAALTEAIAAWQAGHTGGPA